MKRPLYIIEPESAQNTEKFTNNQEFKENFQTAILLALLEKGQLVKWQFDLCIEELQHQHNNTQKSGR